MTGNFSVFLIDDDPSVVKALERLLNAEGYDTKSFTSPKEFLACHDPEQPGCAIVDLEMPELDGLELQQALANQSSDRPIIFLSGRGNVRHTVRAMQAGALDFLEKPVASADLLSAISRAAERDGSQRRLHDEEHSIQDRVKRLTPREFEVLRHVIAGRLNKQICADLGTVEKTVKVHRSRLMRKMGVRSVAALVRLTEKIELRPVER
jgi:FixJ family two-component response regulator